MEKKYAIIENGIVANIIIAVEDPSYMTDLLCVKVDDSVQVGYLYRDNMFIETIES